MLLLTGVQLASLKFQATFATYVTYMPPLRRIFFLHKSVLWPTQYSCNTTIVAGQPDYLQKLQAWSGNIIHCTYNIVRQFANLEKGFVCHLWICLSSLDQYPNYIFLISLYILEYCTTKQQFKSKDRAHKYKTLIFIWPN